MGAAGTKKRYVPAVVSATVSALRVCTVVNAVVLRSTAYLFSVRPPSVSSPLTAGRGNGVEARVALERRQKVPPTFFVRVAVGRAKSAEIVS